MTQVEETTATAVVSDGGTITGPPITLPISQGDLVPVEPPPAKTGKRTKGTKGAKQTKAEKIVEAIRGKNAKAKDRPVESWIAEQPLWAEDHPKHDLIAGSELQGVVEAFEDLDTAERIFPIICLEAVAALYNGVIGKPTRQTIVWLAHCEKHYGLYRTTGAPPKSEFTGFLTMIFGSNNTGKVSKWGYALSCWASVRNRPSPAIPEGAEAGTSPFGMWLRGDHDGFGAGITGAYEAFKDTLEVSSTGTRRSRPARESRDDLIQRAQTAEAVAAQLRSRNEALEKQVDLQFEAGRSAAVADDNAAAVAAISEPGPAEPAAVFAIEPHFPDVQPSEAGDGDETSEGDPARHVIAAISVIAVAQMQGLTDLVAALVARDRDVAQRLAEALTAALE